MTFEEAQSVFPGIGLLGFEMLRRDPDFIKSVEKHLREKKQQEAFDAMWRRWRGEE